MALKKKSILLIMAFLIGCDLCACGKEDSVVGESLVEDTEEVSSTEETKSAEEEAAEQWEKGYDLPVDEQEREEAETDCKKLMEHYLDIYETADKGIASNVVLDDQTVLEMQKKVKDAGYPIATMVTYSNMGNYESVDRYSFAIRYIRKKRRFICIFASGIPGLLLCYGRIGGDTVLKIRKNQIRDKCQSDKYYASIKYMAHSLRGKDRENFIITVCDLNIYLGCICALTCEKNATVEEYIWKTLNNYFQPRKIKFYDKSSGIWKENIKKLNSKDITYYLLACNVMGNMKAIKWYIYNHEVDKAIIIQLAKNMNEEQLVDLIYTLYRSSQNWDKIRGIYS